MKIIFFGTPDYVLPILNTLYKYHEIVAVVTQPPKPSGREQKLEYSAVDTWAHKHKIAKLFDFDDLPEASLGVSAAYGRIIPPHALSHTPHGILNIHPSLLPKYRGSSPIQTQIAEGVQETGVTIIKMDEKMDHGPVVTQFKDEIMPADTFETLRVRLFERSAQILVELIEPFAKGKIKLKPQDHTQATFTKMVTKEDGFIDLKKDDPKVIERKLRAYSPWPGIWTYIQLVVNGQGSMVKKRLKILDAELDIDHQSLIIKQVQLEGKKPVSFKQFKSAYPYLTM